MVEQSPGIGTITSSAPTFSGESSFGSPRSSLHNVFGPELSVLSTPSPDRTIKSTDWMYQSPKNGFIDIPGAADVHLDLFSLPDHSVGSARFSPEGRISNFTNTGWGVEAQSPKAPAEIPEEQDVIMERSNNQVVDLIAPEPLDFAPKVKESTPVEMSVSSVKDETISGQREIVFQDEDLSSLAETIDLRNEIVASGEDVIKIDQPDVSISEVEQIMFAVAVGTLLAEMSVVIEPSSEEDIKDSDTSTSAAIEAQPGRKSVTEEAQAVVPQLDQEVEAKLSESSVIVLPDTGTVPFILAKENAESTEIPEPSYEEQQQLFRSLTSESANLTEEEMKAQLLAYLRDKGYKQLYAQIAEEQLAFRRWLLHQAVDVTYDINEKIGKETANGAEVLSTLGRNQDKREQSPMTLPGEEDGSGQQIRRVLSLLPEMTREEAHKVVDVLSDMYPTGEYSEIMTAPPISESKATIIRSPQRSKSDMVTLEPGFKAA